MFLTDKEKIMAKQNEPAIEKTVKCETCLKEIPASGAKVDESSDYVRHFCGLDCFEKWQQQEHKPKT